MKGEAIACIVLALVLSLTGCLERLLGSDEVEQDTASMAVERHLDSMINEDEDVLCASSAKANGTRYTASEIDTCKDDFKIQKIENPYGEKWILEYDIESVGNVPFENETEYSSDLLEISNVTVSVLECARDSVDDAWECYDWLEMELYVGKMSNGEWLILENYEVASSVPFAQLTSSENSNGDYYVTVVKVFGGARDLEAFSYFLMDSTHTTSEFGEIAMQNLSGNVVGIDVSYDAKCGDTCDDDLMTRSDAVDADDGAIYAVTFNDNDLDGKLSAGDKFTARGTGSASNGPADDDWYLDVKFDNTGDIVGSKRLG